MITQFEFCGYGPVVSEFKASVLDEILPPGSIVRRRSKNSITDVLQVIPSRPICDDLAGEIFGEAERRELSGCYDSLPPDV